HYFPIDIALGGVLHFRHNFWNGLVDFQAQASFAKSISCTFNQNLLLNHYIFILSSLHLLIWPLSPTSSDHSSQASAEKSRLRGHPSAGQAQLPVHFIMHCRSSAANDFRKLSNERIPPHPPISGG